MTETVSLPAPGRGPASAAVPDATPEPTPKPVSASEPTPEPTAASTPAGAFDLLYERHVTPLLRQTFLLTGDWRAAERSVTHAFRRAWERWPEVAVDRDPGGWVRAAAHDHALAPWHRFLPRRRMPEGGGAPEHGPPSEGARDDDRELLEALLSLPPSYRRTLLLHDGLGLGLPETAAESEASTPATAGRLMHAREALAEYVPELSRVAPKPRREMIRSLLEGLVAARPVPEAPPARTVRDGGEHLARRRTGAALGLTALVAAATVAAAVTGPEGHAPREGTPTVSVHSPGREAVDAGADD